MILCQYCIRRFPLEIWKRLGNLKRHDTTRLGGGGSDLLSASLIVPPISLRNTFQSLFIQKMYAYKIKHVHSAMLNHSHIPHITMYLGHTSCIVRLLNQEYRNQFATQILVKKCREKKTFFCSMHSFLIQICVNLVFKVLYAERNMKAGI